jgi:hypothetical protein
LYVLLYIRKKMELFREYSHLLPENIKNEIININIQPIINFISSESRPIKNETELELSLITIRKVKKLLIDNLITNNKITDDQIDNMFKHITENTITGTKHITRGGAIDWDAWDDRLDEMENMIEQSRRTRIERSRIRDIERSRRIEEIERSNRDSERASRNVDRNYFLSMVWLFMAPCFSPVLNSTLDSIICLFASLIFICCLLELIITYILETRFLETVNIPEYIKNITHFLRQLLQMDNVPDVQVEPVAVDITNEHPQCRICQEPFANGGGLSQMPCSHIYHTNCIESWLEKNRTCPICRAEMHYNNSLAAIELPFDVNQYMPINVDQALPFEWGLTPINENENGNENIPLAFRRTRKIKIIKALKKVIRFITSNQIFRRPTSTGGKTKKKKHRKLKRTRRRSRR